RLNGRGGERRLDRALANFLEASSEQGGGVADLGFTRGEQLGSLAELGTAPFDLGADLAAPGFFAQRFVFELGDLACSRDQGFLLALDCGFEGADFRLEFSQLGFLVAQKSFFEKRELNEALPSLAQLFDFQNDGLGSFLDLGERGTRLLFVLIELAEILLQKIALLLVALDLCAALVERLLLGADLPVGFQEREPYRFALRFPGVERREDFRPPAFDLAEPRFPAGDLVLKILALNESAGELFFFEL